MAKAFSGRVRCHYVDGDGYDDGTIRIRRRRRFVIDDDTTTMTIRHRRRYVIVDDTSSSTIRRHRRFDDSTSSTIRRHRRYDYVYESDGSTTIRRLVRIDQIDPVDPIDSCRCQGARRLPRKKGEYG